MSLNFFGSTSSTDELSQNEVGTRLFNIREAAIGTESILSILPDDNVVVNNCTNFGKSLLNVSSLNGLVGLINSADTKVEVIDSGTGEINFTLDNALKLRVMNAYTEVLNELRSLNIVPATDLEYSIGTSSKRYNNGYFSNLNGQSLTVNKSGATASITISGSDVNQQNITFSDSATRWTIYKPANTGNLSFYNSQSSPARDLITLQSNNIIGLNGLTLPSVSNSYDFGNSSYVWNGIYCNSLIQPSTTNSMTFSCNGAERMRITKDGNVGIGTTSPNASLELFSSTQSQPRLILSGQEFYQAANTSTSGLALLLGTNRTGNRQLWVADSANLTQNTTNPVIRIMVLSSANGGSTIDSVATDGITQLPLKLGSQLYLTAGNVGIGKSSPNALLHLEKQYDSGSTLWEASNLRFNARSGGTPWGLGEISSYVKAGPNNSSSAFPGGLLFKTKSANSTSDEVLTTRMCIDSRGYVGVGLRATNPKFNFHINPSDTTSGWTSSENNRGLMITDGTVVRMVLENTSNTSNQRLLVLGNEGNEFRVGVLNDTDGGNTWNKQHIIRASLSTGNVGIGFVNSSSEATEKLEVNGSAKFTGNILVDGDNTRNVGSNGQALAKVYAHEGNFQSIVVHSNTAGNIGANNKPFDTLFVSNIGSSSAPASNIHANVWQTTTDSNLRAGNNLFLMGLETLPSPPLYNLNCGASILLDSSSLDIGCKQNYDATNSELVISTTSSNVERVRIGANGLKTAVNILPTTDNERNIGSSSLKFNTIYANTILNPTSNLLLGATSTNTVVISTTGMSVNSGVAPDEALFVSGNIKVSGNILPNQSGTPKIGTSNSNKFDEGWFNTVYGNGVALTSDRRLKTAIKPITNALQTVLKMNPVEYKMKDGIRIHTGFLADEIKNLYNGEDWSAFAEHKDEFKTQSIQYTEIIALLASSIQELNNKLGSRGTRQGPVQSSGLDGLNESPPTGNLHRCIEISRINELYDRLTQLENKVESNSYSEVKSQSSHSEDFELVHSLMEKFHASEARNNQLELKVDELERKLDSMPKVESKSNEILESDGGINMMELLQQKNFELEQRLIKMEKQNKKLVQAVNKLLRTTTVE